MLLIKQAQIIDGSGKTPFRGDILVDGQKISVIGNPIKRKVDKIIDGIGLLAAPGFIDVNTDSDHHLSLFTNPSQKDFINQGVTTIIGGQCGASLAPLMYGSLASVREWASTDYVNVDWGSVKEFFNVLQRIKLGIRFETLAGHSTIQRDIIGEMPRDLTDSEMEVFIRILRGTLEDGALGMSTGLGDYGKSTPYREIETLAGVIAEHNKVYATHLRDEKSNLLKSVEETLSIARETGAKTIISHFRPVKGFEDEFKKSLELIDKNLADANIYFDVNSFEISLLPIDALLPPWAQSGIVESMLELLENENTRQKIIKEMVELKLGDLTIANCAGQEFLIGKNLEEISKNWEKTLIETLMELMKMTKFKAMVASRNLDQELVTELLFHPRSLIGSNSASLPESAKRMKLERSTSTFPKFLEISQKRGVPLEETIKKITSIPAQIYGLKNKGLIKEGYLADIVLLKEQKISGVILNGNHIAMDNG